MIALNESVVIDVFTTFFKNRYTCYLENFNAYFFLNHSKQDLGDAPSRALAIDTTVKTFRRQETPKDDNAIMAEQQNA